MNRFNVPLSKKKILAISLILTAAVAMGYFFLHKEQANEQSSDPVGYVCGNNDSIVQRATEGLAGNRVVLQELAQEIAKTEGHDTDPNCLLILTHYYIAVSDAENAAASLARMEAIEGFDSVIVDKIRISAPNATNYVLMRRQITFLQELAKDSESRELQGITEEPVENAD